MAKKINIQILRRRARKKGIKTIADLARRVGCSRPAIYFALENPNRYSRVYDAVIAEVT